MEDTPPYKAKRKAPAVLDENPHSLAAEEGMLGCFLANPKELLPHFCEVGKLEWFTHPKYLEIAKELLWMSDEGLVVDLVTVSQHFIDRGLMEGIGGPSKLAELLGHLPTPAHYPHYLGMLQERFVRREAMRLAEDIKLRAQSCGDPIALTSEAITESTSQITALFAERERVKSMAEHVADTMQEWQDIAEKKKVSARPLRWPLWNLKMAGLERAYYLLKAKRGMGKSSFMLDIALQVSVQATDKEPSLIASYEMSHAKIIKRAISNLAMVDNKYLTHPDVHQPSEEIRKQITRAATKIASSPLEIIYQPNLTIAGIEHRARKLRPSFMGIDYIQRMPLPKGYTPKELPAAYGFLSRSVFDLRNELDNTAMVLSHTNEAGEASWSAALQNDADISILIDEDQLLVDKNRDGEDGLKIDMELYGPHYRFEQPSPQPPKR